MINTTQVTTEADAKNSSNENGLKLGNLKPCIKPTTLKPQPESLIEKIRKQVERRLPTLVQAVPYTLRKICGNVFWDGLSKGQQIDAGQHMVTLVNSNQLPLTCAGTSTRNAKLYRLQ